MSIEMLENSIKASRIVSVQNIEPVRRLIGSVILRLLELKVLINNHDIKSERAAKILQSGAASEHRKLHKDPLLDYDLGTITKVICDSAKVLLGKSTDEISISNLAKIIQIKEKEITTSELCPYEILKQVGNEILEVELRCRVASSQDYFLVNYKTYNLALELAKQSSENGTDINLSGLTSAFSLCKEAHNRLIASKIGEHIEPDEPAACGAPKSTNPTATDIVTRSQSSKEKDFIHLMSENEQRNYSFALTEVYTQIQKIEFTYDQPIKITIDNIYLLINEFDKAISGEVKSIYDFNLFKTNIIDTSDEIETTLQEKHLKNSNLISSLSQYLSDLDLYGLETSISRNALICTALAKAVITHAKELLTHKIKELSRIEHQPTIPRNNLALVLELLINDEKLFNEMTSILSKAPIAKFRFGEAQNTLCEYFSNKSQAKFQLKLTELETREQTETLYWKENVYPHPKLSLYFEFLDPFHTTDELIKEQIVNHIELYPWFRRTFFSFLDADGLQCFLSKTMPQEHPNDRFMLELMLRAIPIEIDSHEDDVERSQISLIITSLSIINYVIEELYLYLNPVHFFIENKLYNLAKACCYYLNEDILNETDPEFHDLPPLLRIIVSDRVNDINLALVSALVCNGASLSITDSQGNNAFLLALKRKRFDIVQILQPYADEDILKQENNIGESANMLQGRYESRMLESVGSHFLRQCGQSSSAIISREVTEPNIRNRFAALSVY